MNDDIFSRNELFWGVEGQKFLKDSQVCIFGLGGVGGYCAEALARAGIGALTIVDFDEISPSNINRQIIALHSTIGKSKAKILEDRLKDINPQIKLTVIDDFYSKDFDFSGIDFVADAIDTIRSKIELLCTCVQKNIPVISSMGAGNRIDPTKLYICDISEIENKNAPFISNVTYQLKKRGIEKDITVVASREKPFAQEKISSKEKVITKSGEVIEFNKITPASTPFVASCAGIFMASFIVQKIIKEHK